MEYFKLSKWIIYSVLVILFVLLDSIEFGATQNLRVGQASSSKFNQRPSARRQSVAKINAGRRTKVKPVNSKAVQELTSKSWDLAFCGFKLNFRGKQLNRNNFRFTTSDAASMASILGGEKIQDKIYVWCRTAHLSKVAERKRGKSVATFDVETLQNFQGDIVLNLETVDEILKPYENSFLRENGRTIPQVLSSTRSFQRKAPAPRLPSAIRGSRNSLSRRTLSSPSGRRIKRKIIPESFFLWDNEIVPYIREPGLLPSAETAVLTAIDEWQQWTCIRFNDITATTTQPIFTPHIRFDSQHGCWSNVGKQANGQTISIGSGCEWTGIAAHEIGHALGYYHEQSRPDRDNYVKVNLENVLLGLAGNFEKLGWTTMRTSGVPYDYESLMHYAPLDFSSNSLHTIDPLDPLMISVVGQRESLTFSDIKLANINYCSKVCGDRDLEWDQCQHGGYRNPNKCGECICPKGFSTPFCSSLDAPQNAVCGTQELTATSSYQEISSDGYETTGYPANAYCAWRITAAQNQMVQLEFLEEFEFDYGYLDLTCDLSYVEVRRHPERAGKRFCNKDRPSEIMTSAGSEMTVLMVAGGTAGDKGFKARYRAVPCGGCSSTGAASQPVCTKVVQTKHQEKVIPSCTGPSCEIRDNTDFKMEDYCCPSFTKQGNTCIGSTAPTTPVPTTPAPTTKVPTTPVPTTKAPTTPVPTTKAPTTPLPTTKAPTTPVPTTKAPTTPVPTTKAPTTPVPTTKAPTTPAPTTKAPTTAAPTTKAPTTQNPNIPDADGFSPWGPWTQCTKDCGFCGTTTRFRRCLIFPCRGNTFEFSLCPFKACAYRPVFIRACYYAGSEIWCLPTDSPCYMLAPPSSVFRSTGKGEPLRADNGVQVLGTIDIKTGAIGPLNPSPVTSVNGNNGNSGNNGNNVNNGRGNTGRGNNGRGNNGSTNFFVRGSRGLGGK